MRIASKIRALFIPLFIAPMIFIGFSSWFAAQDGITSVARDFLTFKMRELTGFAVTQHSLLVANDLSDDAAFRAAAVDTIAQYANRLTSSESELVMAVRSSGDVAFATNDVSVADASELVSDPPAEGWGGFSIGGVRRVGIVSRFEPFDWLLIVSEAEDSFFSPVYRITQQSVITGGVMLIAVLIVVGIMSRLITNPLKQTVAAMRGVIEDGDFDRSVTVRYNDETGELADAFNYMVRSLDEAYGDIKKFALSAAYSERRESKIRTVFQRYVPQHVISEFFESPESMLIGEQRELTVLFSDVRDFTTFSETLSSGDVVESLNRYFGLMVDVIDQNEGIVDKYIGDAIMAFFGAPAKNERSVHDAVMAAFSMLSALEDFNRWQTAQGRTPFRIGIAISYGPVTVGNIGSDRKMDYTVIGDMVNVVSRLEGLTKVYQQEILISESVRRHIRGVFPMRMVDRVQVKGREQGLAVWTVRPSITSEEKRAWKFYHSALVHYYKREFETAIGQLRAALQVLPNDYLSQLFLDRSERFLADPPAADWKGVEKLETK